MARAIGWASVAVGAALVVRRLARSRHERFMHPAGRSFAGVLTVEPVGVTGSALLDRAGRHDVTVRLSKGIGTRGGRADVRGLAIRVGELDLLLSTAGAGRVTRHLPVPRRTFDATYATITAYRTGSGKKVYLQARPDPQKPDLGRSLTDVAEGDGLLLDVDARTTGRVVLTHELGPELDADLAFDPVRNSLPDLHPTGLLHGARAFAYRTSQRWRGATPAAPNPAAVARTSAGR